MLLSVASAATGQQWALGGDTWVVGCKIPDCVVMPEFNVLNPDMKDPRYTTGMVLHYPTLRRTHFGF